MSSHTHGPSCSNHHHGVADGKDSYKSSIGIGSYKIPTELYRKNRKRVFERFGKQPKAAIFLQGGSQQYVYDTDAEILFRQESFFYHLWGVNEPELYGVIDLTNGESILFIPKVSAEHELWCGPAPTCEAYKEKYGVDHVLYTADTVEVLKARGIETVHVIAGTNSDSREDFKSPTFKGLENFHVDNTQLYWHLVACRCIKTPEEIDVMRYINKISSEAHIEVMKRVRPGMFEYQLEGIFRGYCIVHGGSRYLAYTCICCTGVNSSVLHYGHAGAPNDKQIQANDMMLMDMGADYQGYCADITCSFPAGGKFNEDHRQIYNAVLAAQQAVFAAMRPGVSWPAMHQLAEKTILKHLVEHGFLNPRGKTIDELHALHLAAVFMPHGLGHMLGLDVHDVGGYPKGTQRNPLPGLKRLRAGVNLEAGMVLTVEPGCYFIKANIQAAQADPTQAPHLNMEKINKFLNFGGVRLEDDVVVTADGIENLTKCPRTIEEVEKVMAEGRAADAKK